MKSNDLISILIPTYNSESRLMLCLESVRKQTYINIEVLVCDGGSIDGTINIIKKFCQLDARFHYIISDKKGRCHQRNLLLDKANGEYLFMLDSDDTISSTTINTLYKLITSRYDVVMPQIVLVGEDGKQYGVYNGINKTISKYITKQNLFKNLIKINIIGCTKMYKKSFVDSHRYDEDLVFGDDIMFNLLLSLKHNYKYCYTAKAKYYYYRPKSLKTESKYINDVSKFLEKIYLLAKNETNNIIKKSFENLLHYYLLFFMIRHYMKFRLAPFYHLKYRSYLIFHSKISFTKKLLLLFPLIYCSFKLFKRIYYRVFKRS